MSILHLTATGSMAELGAITKPMAEEYRDSGMNAARGILITAMYSALAWFALVIVMHMFSFSYRSLINLSLGALAFAPGAIISIMWLRNGVKGY